MEDLTKASHKLAEEIYKQTQAKGGAGPEQPQGQSGQAGPDQGAAGGDSGPGAQAGPQQQQEGGDSGRKKPDDDVIDAEFREEKK